MTLTKWFSSTKNNSSGFSMMSAGNLLVVLFTFVRQIEIARVFGTDWKTDAFAVALVLPLLLREAIAHSIASSFIPIYSSVASRSSQRASSEFISRVINLISVSGIVICAVLAVFSHKIVSVIGPGLNTAQTDMASYMQRILVPVVLLSSLSGVLQGVCEYQRRFALTALLRLAEITASLLVVFLFSGTLGISVLPLSVLSGSVVLFVALILVSGRLRINYRPVVSPWDPDFSRYMKMTIPVVLGALTVSLAPVADKFMASFLQEDSITSLDYANRVVNILLVILFLPMATVANVAFADHTAKRNRAAFKGEIGKLLGWTSAIVLPATAVLMVIAVPLVSVLFQRGEFTSEDSQTVGRAMLFYAPLLATFSICTLFGRAFYAMKDSITPVFLAIWGMLANVLLNVVLIGSMGIGGLALATSIASAAQMVFLGYFLRKRIGGLHGRILVKEHIKIVLSCMVMVSAIVLLKSHFIYNINGTFTSRLSLVVFYIVAGVLAYSISMYLAKSMSARSILSKLSSRFGS